MNTAPLAHKITWAGSKQSYLTAVFFADRDLVDDCLRAYAYFRWADDMIDISLPTDKARQVFIEREKHLIDRLYLGEQIGNLTPEETMLADLIQHDRGDNSGLQSFIRNFIAVLEFDALRKGRQIEQAELTRYTHLLSTAVIDGLQYFIGNRCIYPTPEARYKAVAGAHITHMLRDTMEDIPAGYINIPAKYLTAHNIDLQNPTSEKLRPWVREQVKQARANFAAGRHYIDCLENLRCKLAGYCYCARFERILDVIEKDGYVLRANYDDEKGLSAWLAMAWLALKVTLNHFLQRLRGGYLRVKPKIKPNAPLSGPSIQIE